MKTYLLCSKQQADGITDVRWPLPLLLYGASMAVNRCTFHAVNGVVGERKGRLGGMGGSGVTEQRKTD